VTYCAVRKRPERVAKAATLSEVEALAASYEPAVAKAILKALNEAADAIDLDLLAEALASGNLQAVLDMFGAKLGGFTDALQDVVYAGGALATKSIAVRGVAFHFHRLNPVLVDWLQTYTLGLIREITNSTKESIRTELLAGMKAGKNPRTQATQIKQIVGLTQRQSAAVANFRKELETFHEKRSAGAWGLGNKIDRRNGAQVFKPGEDGKPKDGIYERRLRDFRYDKMLKRSMVQGKPLTPAQIDKMVDAYARKYRKYRAETIARTESMRALNIGMQEAWRQAVWEHKVVEGLVRRYWKVAHDERTCSVCMPVPDMNKQGVGLAVPFSTPNGAVFLPPLHPDCRCHLFIRVLEPEEL
jgi:hypothetical protein